MPDTTLRCYILGDDLRNSFKVTLPSTDDVSDLKEAIKTKKSYTFQHVEADKLQLWNVSVPISSELERPSPMFKRLVPTLGRDHQEYVS